MQVLLSSNNHGKVERFRRLFSYIDPTLELLSPADVGLTAVHVAETADTLLGNAELKVTAYKGKTDLPILGNDTGFEVSGMGLVEAPKRAALRGDDETDLSKEEISVRLLQFWKDVATRDGGEVDAAWVESFVVLYPDGSLISADSRREVLLTDTEFGTPHPQMPVRCLYYSKATDKPAIQHTSEEEQLEMQPVTDALKTVLRL